VRATSDRTEDVAPNIPAAPVARHRILVVDDDPAVGAMIVRLLQGRGYTTEVCSDRTALAEMLEHTTYDLVISDLKSPTDGSQLYNDLRHQSPDESIPLLFITGDTLNRATREFLETTGCPFVEKPFAMEEFLGAVQNLLEQ
jgi:DNA-binding response OmpR family regulator